MPSAELESLSHFCASKEHAATVSRIWTTGHRRGAGGRVTRLDRAHHGQDSHRHAFSILPPRAQATYRPIWRHPWVGGMALVDQQTVRRSRPKLRAAAFAEIWTDILSLLDRNGQVALPNVPRT